jgi:hypothetical protein
VEGKISSSRITTHFPRRPFRNLLNQVSPATSCPTPHAKVQAEERVLTHVTRTVTYQHNTVQVGMYPQNLHPSSPIPASALHWVLPTPLVSPRHENPPLNSQSSHHSPRASMKNFPCSVSLSFPLVGTERQLSTCPSHPASHFPKHIMHTLVVNARIEAACQSPQVATARQKEGCAMHRKSIFVGTKLLAAML